MSVYIQMKRLPEAEFLRSVGLSFDHFEQLVHQVRVFIEQARESDPMKKRGIKGTLSLEDQVLLPLFYLRDYGTFLKLGQQFGVSESYANKIFHKIETLFLKVLPHTSRQELKTLKEGVLMLDASEQRIEIPKKDQKSYYSGKKKSSPESSAVSM